MSYQCPNSLEKISITYRVCENQSCSQSRRKHLDQIQCHSAQSREDQWKMRARRATCTERPGSCLSEVPLIPDPASQKPEKELSEEYSQAFPSSSQVSSSGIFDCEQNLVISTIWTKLNQNIVLLKFWKPLVHTSLDKSENVSCPDKSNKEDEGTLKKTIWIFSSATTATTNVLFTRAAQKSRKIQKIQIITYTKKNNNNNNTKSTVKHKVTKLNVEEWKRRKN